ncbi:amino acid adenylation domain-containing protein [Dactylosporangium sp. AC04546]|uniref:non-ribosomal peptide synthetase n=1 Tax=Dactylosporangium sp. AC04546 TaxID=2862460 RepID=UPI001EDD4A56|nr:non-ribosomal peptide synthetase [Dactylosporangium sp. AC04546]WVK88948.1 amino acid adenylation domain-containing protein [Dactylosporangium sp. AC04546]
MSTDNRTSDVAALRRELLRQTLAARNLATAVATIEPSAPVGARPLAAGQRRMWSVQQLDRDTVAYNVRIALDLTGPVDADLLRQAVRGVVARHDILRTTYRLTDDGQVTQVVHDDLPAAFDRHDVSADRVDELCRALAAAPFDLSSDSPLRVRLVVTGPQTSTLVVVAHHIAWDDTTSEIFFRELMAAYPRPGRDLGPVRQYADVARAAEQAAHGRPDGLAYWRDQLAALPEPLELPMLTGADLTVGADQTRPLRPGAARTVRDLARRDGATTFMVLLAAVTALLHRYTGADDLVVGAPVVNRDLPGGDEAIGYLGNTIALRMQVRPDDTFTSLLARARQVCLDGYAHQDVALDDVTRAVDPDRTRGDAGLFNVVLSQRSPVLAPFRAAGLTAVRRHVAGDAARFDLTLAVETDGDDLTVEANHPQTRHADAVVAQLLEHLDVLLHAVAADPDRRLTDLDLLTAGQLADVAAWNDTAAPVETRLLPDWFAAQAAASPQTTAVLADGHTVGYRDLDERANRLARLLAAAGVGPEHTVAISVSRSVEMVVAVLGVLKSGAAYVPVDPGYPADRVRFMLDDARPGLLLTTVDTAERLPQAPGPRVVRLDAADVAGVLAALPGHPVTDADRRTPLRPQHPAYVIYTSGSTGVPKGVVVSHGALSNKLAWADERFAGLSGHTLMHSSISFDFSVTPLLSTLVAGGTLELCADSPDAIADAVGAATFLKITPSHLPLLSSVRFAGAGPRTLVIAGEALRGEAMADWRPPAGEFDVINEYGPTETTVGCLLHPIAGGVAPAGAVPVGRPVANTACRVLDDRLREVPVGVAGELYVGGVQLARGYLRRPALTAGRFVADPLGAPGDRLYRTGDRVRRLPGGDLEFLGRADDQVKIRGFRVEPGEIESVLLRHQAVAQAVVAARTDGPGGTYLAAYVVPAADADPDVEALRAHVAGALPDHMVPATFTVIAAVPLSPSGKADKRRLPVPSFGTEAAPAAGRAPANDVERTLTALFAELLDHPGIDVDESFFALGGDSIVAIRLVARARRAGLRLTPNDVFTQRTIANLAQVVTVEQPAPVDPVDPVAGDTDGVGDAPFTPIMRSFAERGPLGDGHRMSVVVDGPTGVERTGLTLALQAVIDRHDALRARLTRDGAGPRLEFRPVGSVTADSVLRRVDGPGDVAAELATATAGLAPADGAVLRVVWFDAGPQLPARLLIVAHHLVVDGVSWRILVEDLATAWRAVADGRPAGPAPVATSFRAWSRALTSRAADRAAELPAWQRLLTGPDPVLGARRPDPAVDTWSSVRTVTVTLDAATTGAVLAAVPAAYFAGVDDVLLAALGLAVAAWTDERGTPVRSTLVLLEGHGRQEAAVPGADLSRTVGWFTSQHPVRLDLGGIDVDDAFAGGPAAGAAVRRVKEHLRGLPDHGIGYGMLRYLHPESRAALAGRPEPQLGFNYLGRFGAAGADSWTVPAGGLDAAYDPGMPLPAGLVVNAVTEDSPDGPRLTAHWMHANALFDAAAVADLADLWCAALRGLARHAEGPGAGGRSPSDLPLVALDQAQIDALEAKWKRA